MNYEVWNPGYGKFTYFWGEWPFSQWAYSLFTVDDVGYCSAEQYMMAQKAILFDDQEILELIMESEEPNEQKKLGRMVKNFNLDKWNEVARDIVYKGNYAKFTQNDEMLEALMATDGTLLVEASPYDKIWGIGLNDFDAKREMPWQGTNWLGEVLTKLREDLKSTNKNTQP